MKIYARKENENLDDTLRRFKKWVGQAGIMQDYRKHEFFMNKKDRRKFKADLQKTKKRK